MSSAGSGRRSRQAWRVKMLRCKLGWAACRIGMPPAIFWPSAKPLSGQYLSFAEREEIALLRVQGCSMREVARRLGRAASTISRELRRNAATRTGGLEYRATTAQWHAERSARRSKQAKLALNAALRTYVEERLAGGEQSAPGSRRLPTADASAVQCASAMKPSIKRCSFKVVVRCAVS